jgi:hypothetical protein
VRDATYVIAHLHNRTTERMRHYLGNIVQFALSLLGGSGNGIQTQIISDIHLTPCFILGR